MAGNITQQVQAFVTKFYSQNQHDSRNKVLLQIVLWLPQQMSALDLPGAVVTKGYELPIVHAGNWTHVLWKVTIAPLRCVSSPKKHGFYTESNRFSSYNIGYISCHFSKPYRYNLV